MGIKVLSLFDGISCGQVALNKLGVDVDKYYAYEIDEAAIKVTQYNYPNTIQCGDVYKADFTQYTNCDLLIGGSPCTYWSIAKAGSNRETTSSGIGFDLFMQYVRALKESKVKYFLYENNASISKEIQKEISKKLEVEPFEINSAIFSAQDRKRLYWTNIPHLLTSFLMHVAMYEVGIRRVCRTAGRSYGRLRFAFRVYGDKIPRYKYVSLRRTPSLSLRFLRRSLRILRAFL